MVPHTLDELICDFNYIAHRLNIAEETLIDVPLFYTKQLIKEYCIFPLGSQFVKSNYGLNVASVLFHGPPGTGKTLAALACAYHTDALFIDISPKNVDGKIGTKEELSRTLASAFRIAKNYQPAIIYFDHAEQILPGKVKKAKGFVKNPQAQKMKKYILSMKNLITQDMRVLIIGSTNQGQYLNKKDFKNMFDKSFYFGLPSYADRVKLWKEKIAEKTDQGDSLDYSVLGEMSNGYSHESIIECINYTLSRQRMDRVKFNPLQTDEFISSLAKTEYFYQDDYVKEKEFLNFASGMQDIYDLLNKKREENEKNSKKR
jgi:SpoVK/Ycf46/Vps4 family AAA+-type ATPase